MKRDDSGRRRCEGSSPQAGQRSRVWAALLAAVVATGVLLSGGCQQFDALPALQEGVSDQVTGFQAFNKAFLEWCVDEWKGNPDEAGP